MSKDLTYQPGGPGTRELGAAYLAEISRAGVEPASLAEAAFESELLAPAYRDRFLPRPVFFEQGETARLGNDMVLMHRLLSELPDRLFDGDIHAFCRGLGLSEVQTALVARRPSEPLRVLGRSDLYRSGDGFKLLELNITSALGGFENGLLNRAMLQHPLLRGFVDDRHLQFSDTFAAIAASMAHELGDRVAGRRPVVALTDWPESFSSYEPRLRVMAALMAELDIEALPCHVGQLTADDAGLSLNGRHIDLVYRFFLLEEIVSAADLTLVEPILTAAEREQVVLFARMDAEAYGNKGALAMLSDERHADRYTQPEREMISRFLPWTRYLRPKVTDGAGELMSLPEYAAARREELILKPINLHGGSGVLAGWRTDPETWRAAISDAMGGPWVVQQRVHPEPETFPRVDADGTQDVYFNWGAFVAEPAVTANSGYAGCLARGSLEPEVGVVSMGSGAMVACCFHPQEEQHR
jgi:hypothetical protein